MTGFDCFPAGALRFLTDLKANNTRDWFAAHKAEFETLIKHPAQAFAADVAGVLQDLTGQTHDSKVFRIHRDVRFSKDKTPYNSHVHIAWSLAKGGPAWFFGLTPEALTFGCGVMAFDKPGLARFRDHVLGPNGAALADVTEALHGQGARISAPELKRVPAGCDKDHPRAELLRHKGLTVWFDAQGPDMAVQPGLVAQTRAQFEALRPVFDQLLPIT